MKVVYLHGMGSSGQSATARRLDRSLPGGYEVVAQTYRFSRNSPSLPSSVWRKPSRLTI